jgi:hypothetical protein
MTPNYSTGVACVPTAWNRYWFSLRDSYIAVYESSRSEKPTQVR